MASQSPSVATTRTVERRWSAVDGLRTVAVAVVVAFHSFPDRVTGGSLGVDVFFVISGFVITNILLRERQATGRFRLGAFYLRRWLRLMPALVLVSASVYLLSIWTPRGLFAGQSVGALFGVTYLMDFARAFNWAAPGSIVAMAHTWSLGMEEQFYVVWPLLLLLILAAPRRLRLALWVVLLGVPTVIRIVQWSPAAGMWIYDMPQTRFDELWVGAGLACLVTTISAARILRVATPLFWPSVALLVGAAFFVPVGRPELWGTSHLYGAGFLILALLAAVIVACLALDERSFAARILGSRLLSGVGRKYSYAIYLWHYPVLYAINVSGYSGLHRVAFLVPSVAVLSWLTYQIVERPALRLKRRHEFVPAVQAPRSAVSAGAVPDTAPIEQVWHGANEQPVPSSRTRARHVRGLPMPTEDVAVHPKPIRRGPPEPHEAARSSA